MYDRDYWRRGAAHRLARDGRRHLGLDKDVNMFEAETTEGYKIWLAGDLVINTLWAWMGRHGRRQR